MFRGTMNRAPQRVTGPAALGATPGSTTPAAAAGVAVAAAEAGFGPVVAVVLFKGFCGGFLEMDLNRF